MAEPRADALLRQVAQAWLALNGTLFRGALRAPAFRFENSTRLGAWISAERTIALSETLAREQPWPAVVEVLKHEMAHQYVDEVLQIRDEAPHGAAFRRTCAQIGADPSAAGLPSADSEPKAVRRIRKLLALAESENPHEAEAAARAAHKWMRAHNIDVLGDPTDFGARWIGRVASRHMAHEKALAGLLGAHFFVLPVWVPAFNAKTGKWGKVLEICGRPENLEIAEHAWHFLLQVGEQRWKAARSSLGRRSRGRFLSGVIVGFGEQLREQQRQSSETGLVWTGDPGLDQWVGRRHPRLRSGRRVRMTADRSWQQGRAEGRGLKLRPGVRSGSQKQISGPTGQSSKPSSM